MTFYDDTIESYIKRQESKHKKIEKKENIDKKNQEALNDLKGKLREGIKVDETTFFSISEAKESIKKLKEKRKEIKNVAMNQNEISIQCIELNMSFDEIINMYQGKIDKISHRINNIRIAFSPLTLD